MKVDFPIPFVKMSGSGNDFILIDHREGFLKNIDLSNFSKALCRRKFSVGADGLILIEKSDIADFRWQFFNADGSVAEMCGNGARCAARFAFTRNIAPASMTFETLAGTIMAFVDEDDDNSIKIKLTPPESISLNRKISITDKVKTIHSINTGVPHAVLFVDELENVPVNEWSPPIRYHEAFSPAGTNVNFVQIYSNNNLHVRTYERGVEDETMACGTGAVASAIVAGLLKKALSPVQVTTSGGDKLMIYFSSNRDKEDQLESISEVYLEGQANLIYDGILTAESLEGSDLTM